MGGLETINSQEDFQAKIAQGVVVVDCFAEWCGPCKAIAPKVEEFSKIYSGAKFYQLDVDEQANVAAEVGVRAMPTFIIYKNGEEFEKVVGANPGALEAKIQEALA